MARKKDSAPAQGDDPLDETAQDTAESVVDRAPEEESEPEAVAESATTAIADSAPAQGDLHSRVAEAAEAVQTGPQNDHFALHTVELLTGRLKGALPDAIEATDDEDLKAGLRALQSIL